MRTLGSLDFAPLLQAAVSDGLEAAAVVDIDGKMLDWAGGLDVGELRAIVSIVTSYMRWPEMLARMLEGELIESQLDHRVVGTAIASRLVFVLVVPKGDLQVSRVAADKLLFEIERMISGARADFSGSRPPPAASGGSSSGPAELPVVEWGVTVPRKPS